ncbi:MAG: hypothetical protein ACPL1B_09705 [Thermoprotei archaeon]
MKLCEYLNNYAIIRLLEIMDTIKVGIIIEGWEEIKDVSSIHSILSDSTELGNTIIYIHNRMKLRNIKLPYLLIYTTVYDISILFSSKNVKLASLWLTIGKTKNIPRNIKIISGRVI